MTKFMCFIKTSPLSLDRFHSSQTELIRISIYPSQGEEGIVSYLKMDIFNIHHTWNSTSENKQEKIIISFITWYQHIVAKWYHTAS